MENFNSCEYSVTQKSEGHWLILKISAITFYVLFAVAYFLIIFVTRLIPLGALIPVAVWMLVHFTWRYVNPDYKYILDGGRLTFIVIYGSRSKRIKTSFQISHALAIAPKNTISEKITEFSPERIYSALPCRDASDSYAALYRDESGKRCVFYFVATNEALKLMRFYNSSAMISG